MLYAHNAVRLYMNWNKKYRGAVTVKKICGVLVLIAGLYLIYVII